MNSKEISHAYNSIFNHSCSVHGHCLEVTLLLKASFLLKEVVIIILCDLTIHLIGDTQFMQLCNQPFMWQ